MATTHPQTWIKVNAPVDEGVSGLVSALADFPDLETIESCEGNEERGPWVCFRYGAYWHDSWRELAEFVLGEFSPALMDEVGDDASVRIQVTPSKQVFGELSVRPGAAPRVEAAIRRLARESSAVQRHSSGCCDDTSGTCL